MKKKSIYYTWAHNIEDCLRNGSFVAHRHEFRNDGAPYAQYMNGDFMAWLEKVPNGMIEVDYDLARRLIPAVCNAP